MSTVFASVFASPPDRSRALRVGALAAAGTLLAASATLQGVVGVPHLLADLRELAAHDVGGRPRLLGAVGAGLWLGVTALAVFAVVALHAAWQTYRGCLVAAGVLRIVGVACAAFGAALYAEAGRSPHALGYVLAGALVLAGAGRRIPD
jgi:hypothetical protein